MAGVHGMVPSNQPAPEKKKPHVKKPLNAFMLFMREKRAEVMKECSLKESAAINQILGKKVGLALCVSVYCLLCCKCMH